MSNLALKLKQQKQFEQEPTFNPSLKHQKNPIFSVGEKVLAFLIGLFILFLSVVIVFNQAKIYSLNTEIQMMNKEIINAEKHVEDLHVQVQELSTYERIWAIAHEKGLTLNEKNVKVVQD